MKFKLIESSNNIGFENDKIFLLSGEEYKKYKSVIPKYNSWWWLRSPGKTSRDAAIVFDDGSVFYDYFVGHGDVCVRPALRIGDDEYSNLKIGDEFEKYWNIWVKIDNNLAISNKEIGAQKFGDESNDYKNSHIRLWLLKWLKAKESYQK